MDTEQILTDLRAQRDRIDSAITALEALNGVTKSAAKTATKSASAAVKSAKAAQAAVPVNGKRVVSPEARQRMAAAQKKRYAKAKRAVKTAAKKTAAAPVATVTVKEVQKKTAPKKAGGLTAAGRKRLSEAVKARWAAKKAAAAKTA
jgi:hypothetical protein